MEIFDDAPWQMTRGERAALEGVLARYQPALAVAIGAPEGAGLLARHAGEVHSFDLEAPEPAERERTTFHTGEPNELLPGVLAELAAAGRNIDFVLLDAARSTWGPRHVLEALLDSPALGRAVILIHGVTDEVDRRGVDDVRFPAWPKVALVDLDFVAGHMLAEEPTGRRLGGGLGLVVIDAAGRRYHAGSVIEGRYYPAAALLAQGREAVAAREAGAGAAGEPSRERMVAALERELADAEREVERLRSVARHHEELWRSLMDSWSWRLTGPIRTAKERVRGGGG